jgi:hypothetical protein
MVGLVRFELTTSCTPCKRATRLRYSPSLRRIKKPHHLPRCKPFPRAKLFRSRGHERQELARIGAQTDQDSRWRHLPYIRVYPVDP